MIKETILAQIPEGVIKCLIVSEGSSRFFPAVPFFDFAHIAVRLRRTLLSAIHAGARCFLVMDPFEVFPFIVAEILCDLWAERPDAERPDIEIILLFRSEAGLQNFSIQKFTPAKYPGESYRSAFDTILSNSVSLCYSDGIRNYKDGQRLMETLLPTCGGMICFCPPHLDAARSSPMNIAKEAGIPAYNLFDYFSPGQRQSGGWSLSMADRAHICCFAGESKSNMGLGRYFEYNPRRFREVSAIVDEAILAAVAEGYDTFLLGMENGFGLLCALELIKLRYLHPETCGHVRLAVCTTRETGYFNYNGALRRESDQYIVLAPDGMDEWVTCHDYILSHTGMVLCYWSRTKRDGPVKEFLHKATARKLQIRNLYPVTS